MISGKIVYNRHHFPIPDARGSVVELSQVQPEPSRGPGLHEGGETGQQGTSMLARDIYLPRRGGPLCRRVWSEKPRPEEQRTDWGFSRL